MHTPVDDLTAHAVPPPLRWNEDRLLVLDQRRLPAQEQWLCCPTVRDVAEAIAELAVRGAPAIGSAVAFGLALATRDGDDAGRLRADFDGASAMLLATRPTAVNLHRALADGREAFESAVRADAGDAGAAMLRWAQDMVVDQLDVDRRLAEHGMTLLQAGDRALTHCHTGRIATGGLGTAAAVLEAAHRNGRLAMVWVDETRPLLQGARLTAWELGRAGVPYTLVTDSSAGLLMARGLVDAVFVGADRIAANGDVANKIGTYTVAVLARHHEIPFYVVAPRSTLDPGTARGDEIVLEERDPGEVTAFGATPTAPDDARALNMAFDVTPSELVSAIVTEVGVLRAPYDRSLARALACAGDADAGSGDDRATTAADQPTPRARSSAPLGHPSTCASVEIGAPLCEQLAAVGRRLSARGWLPGTGGNLSAVVALEPLRLAVTASGVDKGRIAPADLVVVDAAGAVLAGAGKASNEVALHLAILRARPDARAVLHTHSTWNTLASLAAAPQLELTGYEQLKGLAGVRGPDHRERLAILENEQDLPLLAGRAEAVLRSSISSHGLLLRGHGLYTWGSSLAEAQRHVETLEFLLELLVRREHQPDGGTR
ncbi:MAG TPA: S-methyl-5-thioribose-1-phosphate isomerase [Solirubrobacteraceae bacterium]|jgi:methylthioribose-1-phosphate isomerase|nr:S-methyl-5-thioribose-1-phosphate isomerase [Solirubrobacteraceae bacterium]